MAIHWHMNAPASWSSSVNFIFTWRTCLGTCLSKSLRAGSSTSSSGSIGARWDLLGPGIFLPFTPSLPAKLNLSPSCVPHWWIDFRRLSGWDNFRFGRWLGDRHLSKNLPKSAFSLQKANDIIAELAFRCRTRWIDNWRRIGLVDARRCKKVDEIEVFPVRIANQSVPDFLLRSQSCSPGP
jgi:hypothetical protein